MMEYNYIPIIECQIFLTHNTEKTQGMQKIIIYINMLLPTY